MSLTVSKETAITTAIVATAATGLLVAGYLHRERTQEVARSTYAALSKQASAAANRGAELAKALQASAAASCNTVATSANSAWESVTAAINKAKSKRSLRRVRSFPIVAEDDDVAAGKDQKRAKRAKSVKKATQEAEQMGVPVQVMAK